MSRKAAFIYDDTLSKHVLSDAHPMKPVRLRYTYELLEAYSAFAPPQVDLIPPRAASEDELLSSHTSDYVQAVRRLGDDPTGPDQAKYNFGQGDNPAYKGIFEASALSTGASIQAAELLLSGEVQAAFNISGGLHHAMPGYAYGFCVFNDPVVAIKYLVSKGLRVAYVDIDCHHGDGVQYAFYDTDAVLTISLHESGSFLFPGTGFPQEIGAGRGRGYSVNVPLYPYTSDEVYLWAFSEVVPPLLQRFAPDVLVTQLGIDSHFKDPITHLALTVQGFTQAVSRLAESAPSMWLALGGGGYDLQAVARAWTSAFGVMSEQVLPDEIPEAYSKVHGVTQLEDPEELPITDQVMKNTKAFAEATVTAIHQLIFPQHGIRVM